MKSIIIYDVQWDEKEQVFVPNTDRPVKLKDGEDAIALGKNELAVIMGGKDPTFIRAEASEIPDNLRERLPDPIIINYRGRSYEFRSDGKLYLPDTMHDIKLRYATLETLAEEECGIA